MPEGWDVSRELCELLASGQPYGIRTLSQAALVVQHCSVKGISLLEFGQQFRLDGFAVMPNDDPYEMTPSDPAAAAEVVSADEVRPAAASRKRRSKRLFEEPATGAAIDPPAGVVNEAEFLKPEKGVVSAATGDPEPKFEDPAKVAALLSNPEPPNTPPAVNARGQLLCSEDQLREIYRLGEKLGMSRVEVDAGIQQKARVRVPTELTNSQAKALIASMGERAKGR